MMSLNSDTTIGAVFAGTGSVGLYLQMATDLISSFVIWGNALLVIGGLYLMWRRIRRDRKKSIDS